MHRLALLATLLMACAPVVSRWVQATPAWPGQAMCTTDGLRAAGDVLPGQADPAGVGAQDPGGPPSHGDHGPACDYCVLAARLLPTPAIALPLAPPLSAAALANTVSSPPPDASHWPAHAPRGPPIHA